MYSPKPLFQALNVISTLDTLAKGDFLRFLKAVEEIAAETLNIEKVSVWMAKGELAKLDCIDLFQESINLHSTGSNFDEIIWQEERKFFTKNQYIEPQTPQLPLNLKKLLELYRQQYSISTYLHVAIQFSEKYLGLICFEHIIESHQWLDEEIFFAISIADLIALCYLNQEKNSILQALEVSEAATLQEKERLGQILSVMQIGLVLYDQDLRILWINDWTRQMYPGEQLIGQLCHDKFYLSTNPCKECPVMECFITKQLVVRELFDERHRQWFQVINHPMKDQKGNVFQVLESKIDITKQKQSEENRIVLERRMQQAQKLESLGILAGGIAHDFNNLLMGILGNVDLALLDLSNTQILKDYLENIKTTSIKAADLSKQMLAYSGKGQLVIQTFNIRQLIEQMHSIITASISKKILLEYTFNHPSLLLTGDSTQIHQVVLNLILNAAEAIGDSPGKISITVSKEVRTTEELRSPWIHEKLASGEYIWLQIADTGSGMSKDTMSKIFDPFFSTKFIGRGLGLAVVLGILRGHHGSIKVTSVEGHGTTFDVFLPSISENLQIPQNIESEIKPKITLFNGTILVVDDEPQVRGVSKRMLQKLGLSVLLAENGHEAIQMFKEHMASISAILLDLTMPEMDGIECFKKLREIQPSVKFILSSGYNEQDWVSKLDSTEKVHFIQKPYTLTSLEKIMRKVL